MNVTGLSNYSKETVGLRQPKTIQDQQFKLIYVFPLLFADTVSQQTQLSCRKFQTISYLREIIVNNSLNIISMASKIQPDSSQSNNVAQLIGNALLTGGGSNIQTNLPVINQSINPMEVQQRVREKTESIKRYLDTDPRTKKLIPSVEIITLNNLLDVPLIVGTKQFTVSTNSLLYILSIAIVTETPLDKISNVENIIRKLKSTKEEDWFKIFSTLAKKNSSFCERWANKLKQEFPSIQLNWLGRKVLGFLEKEEKIEQEKKDFTNKPSENQKERSQIFNILKLTKNKLDDVLLNYKFVLDPALLKNQIGLDTANNTMETTITRLSTNQQQIFMQMYDKFIELLSTSGSVLLSSVFNTLFPAPMPILKVDPLDPTKMVIDGYRQTNTDLNFLELKDKHIDVNLNKDIKNLIFNTFSKEISNSLSSISPNETKVRVDLLKSMCQSMSKVDEIVDLELKKIINTYGSGYTIESTNFSSDELDRFTKSIFKMSNTFATLNKRFENVFGQLVNNSANILSLTRQTIYTNLESFFRDITKVPEYVSMMTYLHHVDNEKVKRIYIPQVTDSLFQIFYFFFLYRLQAAICQYMDIIDIEIESKVNDVFDFPNYTLVIPIDIIIGVHAAFVAGSFKNLINDDNPDLRSLKQLQTMNDNYAKGAIKFIFKRLKVPAIIVVDDKKKELYYQFMFMSAPEKMSNITLDTFIKTGA